MLRAISFSIAAAVGVALIQPTPETAGAFPQVLQFEGELAHADYERQFERVFDVPVGTRRIEVALSFTGAEERTVLDLGLRGPAGLRGWSGGREKQVHVSELTATRGYLPGLIEQGQWAVIIGVANIRSTSRSRYVVTITLSDSPSVARPTLREGAGWYAGDLHAHSGHSDGKSQAQSGIPVPGAVDRVFAAAVRAGLDFVLLSDHNTAAHWLDVDRLQSNYDRMLLLHGREITTYRGHANTVGESAFLDLRLGSPTNSPASVLGPIASAGAFISINHPTRPDDETCMGCGWNVADAAVLASVHGVEVINGDKRDGALFGWPYWAALLNRGYQLTAVGGSDDHTPDVVDEYNLGAPTTVVWATELSESALVAGLKSGRVYLRTRGSAGPALEFSARTDGASVEMGGSTVPGRLVLQVRVTGADGASLEWIQRGRVIATDVVNSRLATREVVASPGDWFSVIVRDAGDPIVLSNAIYVR